jgi:hypothetical protein
VDLHCSFSPMAVCTHSRRMVAPALSESAAFTTWLRTCTSRPDQKADRMHRRVAKLSSQGRNFGALHIVAAASEHESAVPRQRVL